MNSDDTIKELKNINDKLKLLVSESIKEIYWDEKATADQYLNIVTKKRTMRIGANDCGIWEDRTRY